ncbi:UDP-2,4-diacetamido-2,4,6-trideoxy-beta-L-altropyranose hydrolase [Lachnospiraceae bacterium KHCPX20]|nr:UDP-2,4-diacetamido-2,4,6-trideoxy-beta-L-altropyranose hydrolase [Lachnospiraceae bacterium KHCPX20]
MTVIFRVDANKNIGMGHIMRCLSIADVCRLCGYKVKFILADDAVSKLIKERGYSVIVLYSDYRNMEEELKVWPSELSGLIFVDSYFVTEAYLSYLRERVRGKLIYLDDIYAFPYPVDVVINYNAYATPDIYNKLYSRVDFRKPKMIIGSAYAPLRTMFRGIDKKKQPDEVKNILVSTGGSDELHLQLQIIRSLTASLVGDDCFYHFLLGAMNVDKEEIKRGASLNEHFIIHENVTDMKSLICSCDIAISAAGSTLYEIASCGVPLITYSLADNQLQGAEAFEKLGMAINIGDIRDPVSVDGSQVVSGKLDSLAVTRILMAMESLSKDKAKRSKMGEKMQQLIDGFGTDRLVREIMKMCPDNNSSK